MRINQNNDSNDNSLILKIAFILETEINKDYEEMDAGLVYECVDFLMEMEGDEKRLTSSEIRENIKEIPFVDEFQGSNKTKGIQFTRKAFWVAACLTILMLVANLAAAAFGTDIVSLFKQWGVNFVDMIAGEKLDAGSITIIKPNYSASYDTIEELLAAEGLQILYPSYLPDGYSIHSVTYVEFEGKQELVFFSGNADVSVQVGIDARLTAEELENPESIEKIADYTCYIVSDVGFVQASFVFENNVYTVKTNSYDETKKIIENFVA